MKRGAYLAELHRGVMDKRHPLDRTETIIGRDLSAHIRIDDGSVSRQHAAIVRRGDAYVLRDLGSRNGTIVNEQTTRGGAERELRLNDCIFIGKAVFCFLEAEEKLDSPSQVSVDGLTALPARQSFINKLGDAMQAARTNSRQLALFLVGVDDVAVTNEQYGPEAGDAVLQEVATRIQRNLDGGMIAGRLRGAVFGLIVPDLLDGVVLDYAEKLRRYLELTPLLRNGASIPIRVSIGASSMLSHDRERLLEAIDAALSQAKQRGTGIEKAVRDPTAETFQYQRRVVPEGAFVEFLRPPAIAFAVGWGAPSTPHTKQTPLDFELQQAIEQNLSGTENGAYLDRGGWVVVALPRTDLERVPRLCEAIRAAFDRSLARRGAPPMELYFGPPSVVMTATEALGLAHR